MAEQKLTRFQKIQERFKTDDVCRKYLFSLRWPNGFICPRCGCNDYYLISTRNHHQCKNCRYQVSVTAGTVMDRSHLPLRVWLWAIYLVACDKRGYSAMQLSCELNLPYNTAWFLLHRIRHAMSERDNHYMLAGIVELDDTYFGKPKKGDKRGRGTGKIKVLAALSKDKAGKPQFAKMQVVPNLKGRTVANFTQHSIFEGSVVQSDAYYSYRKPLAEKYMHQYEIFDTDSKILHWLHIVIGNAKAFVLGTFHGLGEKHMQSYLDEFCYRFNRRSLHGEIFSRLLCAVAYSSTLRFADLTL
jgi:transposase-like protein